MEKFIKYQKVNDNVEVSFNVRGNEYKEKFYVSLSAWKVFKAGDKAPNPELNNSDDSENDSGLPF